jgi:hypothetical protein
VPAAAVTPAPEAYIKVVAVKKLVVGSGSHGYVPSLVFLVWLRLGWVCESVSWLCSLSAVSVSTGADGSSVGMLPDAFNRVSGADGTFTLNKFECSKQAYA